MVPDLKSDFAGVASAWDRLYQDILSNPFILHLLLSIIAGIVAFVLLILPLTRRALRRKEEALLRFKETAIADGRAVTAYLDKCEHHSHEEGPARSGRNAEFYVRYKYRPSPAEAPILTGTYARATCPPDSITVYLYPGNPKHYLTEGDIENKHQTKFTALAELSALAVMVLTYLLLRPIFG